MTGEQLYQRYVALCGAGTWISWDHLKDSGRSGFNALAAWMEAQRGEGLMDRENLLTFARAIQFGRFQWEPPARYVPPDGHHLEVEPQTLGEARIISTDGLNVEVEWRYSTVGQALTVFETDGDEVEPQGWVRTDHNAPLGTSRRRDKDGFETLRP